MVVLRKKRLNGRTYYYLVHSVRTGKRIRKKEVYLGPKLPPNVNELKTKFTYELYKEKWLVRIDRIRENFAKNQKRVPGSVREKELLSFATRFTYDTQRIEGSTLTLRETADLLERQITPSKRPLNDVKEAEAHRDLFLAILTLKKDISLQMILDWHWKLFSQTKPDIAGKVRNYQVAISGSKFLPPSPVEVYPMLTEFFRWYNKNKDKMHPVEFAAFAHLRFVTVHPFGDGNGRVSRLVMNFILNRKGYPMVDIPYSKRSGYYNALQRSQTTERPAIFLQWFFRNYIREHERLLK